MKSHQTSLVSSLLFHSLGILILIFATSSLFLLFAYELGQLQSHVDIPHSFSQIFQISPEHHNLTQELIKKKHRHTILTGNKQSGLFEFLQYYADTRANKGKHVIVRRKRLDWVQELLLWSKQIKQEVDMFLNGEKKKSSRKEWVYIEGQMSVKDLQDILQKHPKDRILIGIDSQQLNDTTMIQNYKIKEFPVLNRDELAKVIVQEFEISAEQVNLLLRFYPTIPLLFQNLDYLVYSHPKHLGHYYFNISKFNSNQEQIFNDLCLNGSIQIANISNNLEEGGIIVFNGQAYWAHPLNRLNYELQTLKECVQIEASKEILYEVWKKKKSIKQIQVSKAGQVKQEKVDPKKKSKGKKKKAKKEKKAKAKMDEK